MTGKIVLFISTLIFSFFSQAALATTFSLLGVQDGTASYSVTADGITMVVDSPAPSTLSAVEVLDISGLQFGQFDSLDITPLYSFDVSFDETVLVTSYFVEVTGLPGNGPIFSVEGNGVLSTGNVGDGNQSELQFNNGPLKFLAGEAYTFFLETPIVDMQSFVICNIKALYSACSRGGLAVRLGVDWASWNQAQEIIIN